MYHTLLALLAAGALSSAALASEGDVIAAAEAGDGKTDSWDEAIRVAMLSTYDKDASGAIESTRELKAISCTVWSALDAGVRRGWEGTGMRQIYGFRKGYIWVGYAWGIDEKLTKKADKAAAACGID